MFVVEQIVVEQVVVEQVTLVEVFHMNMIGGSVPYEYASSTGEERKIRSNMIHNSSIVRARIII